MGLDIYFHRVNDKENYIKYIDAVSRKDKFETKYETNHEEELHTMYKTSSETNIDYWSFLNDDEKIEKEKLDNEIITYKELSKYESTDIDELYMRKQNWMVFFVQERHPELLINSANFGNILKDGYATLDITDIEELINRMGKILINWKEFNGPEFNEYGLCTEEYKSFYQNLMNESIETAIKLLPTGSRFFFGSTDYDWSYYTNMKYYYDEFKKELQKMYKDNHVLAYIESW